MPHLTRSIVLVLLSAALTLSGCGASPYAVDDATRTPLPGAITPTPPAPTSTLAPTVVRVADLPEVSQARQLLAEGRYDDAVTALNELYGRFRDDPTLRELLATGYMSWGDQLVQEGQGAPQGVNDALQKFVSGLAVAPDGSQVFGDLSARERQATGYLKTLQAIERLTEVVSATATVDVALRTEADTLIRDVQQIFDQDPAYPGLQPAYVRSLLLAAQIYAGSKGTTSSEIDQLAGRREEICILVLEVEPDNADAERCVERARAARLALTPTVVRPTAATAADPCAPQGCLRFQVVNYNDDPTCISVRITGINTGGWGLTVDGLRLSARFGGGDARVCGLGSGQQVTITVRDGNGNPVRGGAGIPSKGSAIMTAEWR